MRSPLGNYAPATRATVVALLLIGLSLAWTQPAPALEPAPGIGGTWSCDCDAGSGTCTYNSVRLGVFAKKRRVTPAQVRVRIAPVQLALPHPLPVRQNLEVALPEG